MWMHCRLLARVFILVDFILGIATREGYRIRDTVRIGHAQKVKLPSEENRTVEVVTVSDAKAGMRAFMIDNFLSEDECRVIRSQALASSLEKSRVGKDFPELTSLRNKKKLRNIFRQADADGDGYLEEKEVTNFLRDATDLVDYNHTELILRFIEGTSTESHSSDRKLSFKMFAKIDWSAYFAWLSEHHPARFARDSSQTWLKYESPLLNNVLRKVAAVTKMPYKLVRAKAEDLQLLRYGPNGSHYSCHHDSTPDEVDDFRFLTFFLFLNDVKSGGETVLFGTDLNGTYPERHSWRSHDWENLEPSCQPTRSCPEHPSGRMQDPFLGAAVIKPKMGRALFWYNTEVDDRGRGVKFVWSSIHAGCPTRGEEKWAANIWLHAGPFRKQARGARMEEL